ncbi:hypothetical protein [Herbiconiux sp. L3-i23]|uniref:coiled-coil domain-containing protein n=1 Tax=Herbiconiux sp. L3-i23 TaxID=2905871 RepID=UPI00205755D6|nr:hypothetical protein [Herbiconiux sp. L3-i23]BDI22948.1 hypothetical protein L3i23_17240 [Herbiconiux sp. L3-i23]
MTARRPQALLRAALVAALVAGAELAEPAVAADYPSWDEVADAKSDAAATQTEVSRIAGLLDGLEAEAARLGDVAVDQAAASSAARAAADEAAAVSAALAASAAEAEQRARDSSRQAGAVAASMARAGDPVLDLWLSGSDADDLLGRIGTMSKVTESLALLRDAAAREQRQAESLGEQAEIATRERDRFADAAQARSEEANAAQQSAEAALAEMNARSSTLYEQLAELNDTSSELERQYRAGQQLEDSYSGGTGSGGSSGGGTTGGGGSGGSGEELGGVTPGAGSMSPAEARAHAATRMPAYGWNDGEYQCLVWLWTRESSWRWNAYNGSSGAYGIPQSLPGSKMAAAGGDWRTNAATQIEWGLGYIANRYGSPCAAWAHSEDVGWY